MRNGSISGFATGVDLSQGYESVGEGLRISSGSAINANGLVSSNIAANGGGTGIVAQYGTVIDSVVEGFAIDGINAAGIVRGNTSRVTKIGLSVFAQAWRAATPRPATPTSALGGLHRWLRR